MTTAPVHRGSGETRSPRRGRGATPRLPRLVLLPSSRRRSRVPFALAIVLLIGSGLIGLLLLNTVLAQDAFVLYQFQQQNAALTDQEQQLRQSVAAADAPNSLASRAAALGMVPGGDPLFLRLPDGAVLGDPKAAQGVLSSPTARASIAPTPSPSPSAHPTGRSTLKPTLTPTVKTSPSQTLNPRLRLTQPQQTAKPQPTATRKGTKP
jgi:hypothetical protein